LRALFLTWDGPQQSYLESLFFPIFSGLKAHGVELFVRQVTWASSAQLEPTRQAARRFHLTYDSLSIPPRLRPALPAIVAYGAASALRYAAQHDIRTLFPRSLIPMAMALLARRARPKLDLTFDADGFMADERLDFGGWRATGPAYRTMRHVEAAGVRSARSVVCRTHRAREILIERAGGDSHATRDKIFVAPNAKNAEEFSPGSDVSRAETRAQHGIAPETPWVVYVGSIGAQYCPQLMLGTFAKIQARRPDARLSCFTLHRELVDRLLPSYGLLPGSVEIRPAAPREVPGILAAGDLGFAFRRESFSQRGISPIKVGEYLLCGLPVVASRVGDLDEQLGSSRAALLIDTAREESASSQIADWFLNAVLPERAELRRAARELGLRWFELERCVETYARMFKHEAKQDGR
jgi:glycosyltransferase involved in cell wall biosynthesis